MGKHLKSSYLPVHPDYFDLFREESDRAVSRVIYFGEGNQLEEVSGKISGLRTDGFEVFLTFVSGAEVRIDRIITVNGKPGPAYDEYDAYALACLNCNVQAGV